MNDQQDFDEIEAAIQEENDSIDAAPDVPEHRRSLKAFEGWGADPVTPRFEGGEEDTDDAAASA